MKPNILIVEDEIRIRYLIKDYFLKENFNVLEASNGKDALEIFSSNQIDCIILDIMMPVLDGFDVCSEIRKVSSVPIIILTAREDEEDKLLGYNLGADDYVTKPFSPKVLVAKTKALLKRTDTNKDSSTTCYGILKIQKLSRQVLVNDIIINLSPKEYDLLLYLVNNATIALSRDKILDNVWGIDFEGDLRTVDTSIKRLREKLGAASEYISTVRGSGYRFEVAE